MDYSVKKKKWHTRPLMGIKWQQVNGTGFQKRYNLWSPCIFNFAIFFPFDILYFYIHVQKSFNSEPFWANETFLNQEPSFVSTDILPFYEQSPLPLTLFGQMKPPLFPFNKSRNNSLALDVLSGRSLSTCISFLKIDQINLTFCIEIRFALGLFYGV